jgi:hypothetical protein
MQEAVELREKLIQDDNVSTPGEAIFDAYHRSLQAQLIGLNQLIMVVQRVASCAFNRGKMIFVCHVF